MRAGNLDELAKEGFRGRVMNEVVGQNTRGLVGADGAETAILQMADDTAKRLALADKASTVRPSNAIDVYIRLDQAGSRLESAGRADPRNAADAAIRKHRKK